jgi:hypothetical protein
MLKLFSLSRHGSIIMQEITERTFEAELRTQGSSSRKLENELGESIRVQCDLQPVAVAELALKTHVCTACKRRRGIPG